MTNPELRRRTFSLGLLALAAWGQKSAPQAVAPAQPKAAPPSGLRVSDLRSLQALLDTEVQASGIPGAAAAVFDLSTFRLIAATGVRVMGRPEKVKVGDLWHL